MLDKALVRLSELFFLYYFEFFLLRVSGVLVLVLDERDLTLVAVVIRTCFEQVVWTFSAFSVAAQDRRLRPYCGVLVL